MPSSNPVFITLNTGSSSVKFSVYEPASPEPIERVDGQVDSLGAHAVLKVSGEPDRPLGQADHAQALQAILPLAAGAAAGARVVGVGHRIAHGGLAHTGARVLSPTLLDELETLVPLAPLHQPYNLAAVKAAREAFPDAVQMGCFDTSFHRQHPWVNDTFALPRRFYEQGVRRYGFHGLSYDYVSGEMRSRYPQLAAGCVVIVHLGNGASMCAVRNGRSIASSMGFSALDGLPMGTRCGQLDPGALLYLMEHEGLTIRQLTEMLYEESGLRGLSGISHDMRTLEQSTAPEAHQAIDYFVFRIRREIGAMAATLGGMDALVFCGGIGENSARIRAAVCADMSWMGVRLDGTANQNQAECISQGEVAVLRIRTDEQRVIARALQAHLAGTT